MTANVPDHSDHFDDSSTAVVSQGSEQQHSTTRRPANALEALAMLASAEVEGASSVASKKSKDVNNKQRVKTSTSTSSTTKARGANKPTQSRGTTQGTTSLLVEQASASTTEPQQQQQQQQPPVPHQDATVQDANGVISTGISRNDVLCGRGGLTNHHLGNVFFRRLVRMKQSDYLMATKREKAGVAKEIVDIIRGLTPTGRFLKRDPKKDGVWVEIGDRKAREKTSQALREGAPELREEIHEQQQLQQQMARAEETQKMVQRARGGAAHDHDVSHLERGRYLSHEGAGSVTPPNGMLGVFRSPPPPSAARQSNVQLDHQHRLEEHHQEQGRRGTTPPHPGMMTGIPFKFRDSGSNRPSAKRVSMVDEERKEQNQQEQNTGTLSKFAASGSVSSGSKGQAIPVKFANRPGGNNPKKPESLNRSRARTVSDESVMGIRPLFHSSMSYEQQQQGPPQHPGQPLYRVQEDKDHYYHLHHRFMEHHAHGMPPAASYYHPYHDPYYHCRRPSPSPDHHHHHHPYAPSPPAYEGHLPPPPGYPTMRGSPTPNEMGYGPYHHHTQHPHHQKQLPMFIRSSSDRSPTSTAMIEETSSSMSSISCNTEAESVVSTSSNSAAAAASTTTPSTSTTTMSTSQTMDTEQEQQQLQQEQQTSKTAPTRPSLLSAIRPPSVCGQKRKTEDRSVEGNSKVNKSESASSTPEARPKKRFGGGGPRLKLLKARLAKMVV